MSNKYREGPPYERPLQEPEAPLTVESKKPRPQDSDQIDEETRRKLAAFLTRRD